MYYKNWFTSHPPLLVSDLKSDQKTQDDQRTQDDEEESNGGTGSFDCSANSSRPESSTPISSSQVDQDKSNIVTINEPNEDKSNSLTTLGEQMKVSTNHTQNKTDVNVKDANTESEKEVKENSQDEAKGENGGDSKDSVIDDKSSTTLTQPIDTQTTIPQPQNQPVSSTIIPSSVGSTSVKTVTSLTGCTGIEKQDPNDTTSSSILSSSVVTTTVSTSVETSLINQSGSVPQTSLGNEQRNTTTPSPLTIVSWWYLWIA